MGAGGGCSLTGAAADTLEATQQEVERMTDAGELSEPVQDGSSDASREQKIAGLASQVAADIALKPVDRRGEDDIVDDLRLRFSDAGIVVTEDELVALAGTIHSGA